MLRIYNTLTRSKDEFKPITPGEVTMYTCGPTVYDYFHIGNARSFIMSDMIRRYLLYSGYKVKYVMNITDIDDKIIKRANEEGIDARQVAENYTKAFLEDIEKIKIKKADVYPKATDHIHDIISMIARLIDNGIAYNADGDVFYEISKFNGYGKLSGKNTEDLEAGARVEVNEIKNNPFDFALWKKHKEGEPYWESPWGNGRPGWHIECSAMGCKHLGETFDIHSGGTDLIFPHHENEIAQSEGATGKQFVNYWIHFGFLNIDNEKMSKSLGNFFTLRDFIKKYDAETLRYFYAQTHYASPLNFTDEALSASAKGLERIQNLYDKLNEMISSGDTGTEEPAFDLAGYYTSFNESMDDDFNTPKAVAVIFDFAKDANRIIHSGAKFTRGFLESLKEFMDKTAVGVFEIIKVHDAGAGRDLADDLIGILIKVRQEAKISKNYALADLIRNELNALGVILQDSKEKTTYKIH